MSESQGTAWGMCAAYGCPLFGTMGSEGAWYCFCHAGKPSVFNDAITRELRENQIEIVEMTIAIRQLAHGIKWSPDLQKALKSHSSGAVLEFDRAKDINARGWLQRLERHLIESTSGIGEQKRIPATVPTAKVIGPTHALDHYSEVQP